MEIKRKSLRSGSAALNRIAQERGEESPALRASRIDPLVALREA